MTLLAADRPTTNRCAAVASATAIRSTADETSRAGVRSRPSVAARYALLGWLLISAANVFILSAGGAWPLPSYSAYMNRQAEAFARGQTHLVLRPPPGLIALPDPYDPDANRPYRRGVGIHDTVLFDGKLYLYWGPVPALLLSAVKPLVGPRVIVGDEWLVLAFTLGTNLAAALLLRRLWRRCFPGRSPAVILVGLLLLGLSTPATYFLARPAVYEVAIAGGQCFLLFGLLLGWRTLDLRRPIPGLRSQPASDLPAPPLAASQANRRGIETDSVDVVATDAESRPQFLRWVDYAAPALSGVCLALAVGCRTSLAVAVVAIAGVVGAVELLAAARRDRPARRAALRLSAFGLPLLAGAVALAGYNQVRFGTPLEFGQRFQLTGANYRAIPHLFSPANALPGLWSYLARPPAVRAQFPFVRAQVGEGTFPAWVQIPPNYETHETIAGLAFTAPAFVLAGLPLLGLATRGRRSDGHSRAGGLRLIVLFLVLAAGLGFAPILSMVGSTQRYLMDLWPCCAVLAAAGLWQLSPPGRRPSPTVRVVVAGLVGWTLALGVLFGFTGYYDHFRTWNHSLYQALGGD